MTAKELDETIRTIGLTRDGAATPLVFFDPQHRGVLDYLKFGHEGARDALSKRGASQESIAKILRVTVDCATSRHRRVCPAKRGATTGSGQQRHGAAAGFCRWRTVLTGHDKNQSQSRNRPFIK
jgi:hypothetical protein